MGNWKTVNNINTEDVNLEISVAFYFTPFFTDEVNYYKSIRVKFTQIYKDHFFIFYLIVKCEV